MNMSIARTAASLLLLLLLSFFSNSSHATIVTNNTMASAASATTNIVPSLLLMSSTTMMMMTKNNESSSSSIISVDQININGTDDVIEDYDYNVDESLVTYDWAQLIPPVVVYSIVLLVGIFGNALIIIAIARYRRLKTITNIFLASLASADLLLVTICVPVNVAKLFSYTWTFGVFLCKFVHYMQNVSAICSVLTLTAMSIERYYAIVHPMRAQYLCTISQARKVIICTWIASFIFALPILWIQIHLPVGERVPAYWCVRDWENPIHWQIYEIYMLVLVLVIPLSIMAYTYGAMGREIWRVTYLRSAMTNESALETRRTATDQLPDVLSSPEIIGSSNATSNSAMAGNRDGPSTITSPTSTNNGTGTLSTSAITWTDNGSCSAALSNNTNRRGTVSSCSTPGITNPPTQRGSQSASQTADQQTARQVVKMLVAVVVLFTVCWSPYLIDNVLMSFELLPGARTGPVKHMRIAFHLLSYINSCCNPLVYGFMSKSFRRAFRTALRLGPGRQQGGTAGPNNYKESVGCCCCKRKTQQPFNNPRQSAYELSRGASQHPLNQRRISTNPMRCHGRPNNIGETGINGQGF